MPDQCHKSNKKETANNMYYVPTSNECFGAPPQNDSGSGLIGESFRDHLVLVPLSVLKMLHRSNMECPGTSNAPSSSDQLHISTAPVDNRKIRGSHLVQNELEKTDRKSMHATTNIDFYTTGQHSIKVCQQKTNIEKKSKRTGIKIDIPVNDSKKHRKTLKSAFSETTRTLSNLDRQSNTQTNFAKNWDLSKKCKVCGDIESKHSHYGGKSCQSCRAFFRRCVKRFTRYFIDLKE